MTDREWFYDLLYPTMILRNVFLTLQVAALVSQTRYLKYNRNLIEGDLRSLWCQNYRFWFIATIAPFKQLGLIRAK